MAFEPRENDEFFQSPAQEAAAEARAEDARKQVIEVSGRVGRELAKRAFAEMPYGADDAMYQDAIVDEFAAALQAMFAEVV